MIEILRFVNRWVQKLEKGASWISAMVLIVMMGVVNANVILRPMGLPIWGIFEVVGFLGAVVISFSLIHPTLHSGHLSVEILVTRLPKTVQVFLAVFKRLAGLLVFSLISWQLVRYGFKTLQSGQVSGTLKLPLAPILWGIAAAFGFSALVLFLDLLNHLFHVERKDA